MDPVLVEYLNSGDAWLVVGSGPSNEMGYPSWPELAQVSADLALTEGAGKAGDAAIAAVRAGDHPRAFQIAFDAVGPDRTLEVLRSVLTPKRQDGRIYELLARWPIAVYLTTNFDNEIQRHLARLGQAYETYSNRPEHFGLLVSGLAGAVVRLHGDLRSPEGLVLTSTQYSALATGEDFRYWRTRMTSVFQMQRTVVMGYSLSDPHIRAVLEAAKVGAPATHSVCWLSPQTSAQQAAEYSEKYRIRVIPYPNTDDHSGLLRTAETISKFVVPREGVGVRRSIAAVLDEGRRGDPAATAVYVFNRLAPHVDLSALRRDVAVGAVESALPALRARGQFTIDEALDEISWPRSARDQAFLNQVERRAVRKDLLVRQGETLAVAPSNPAVDEHRGQYEHLRSRFLRATEVRLQRDCTWLDSDTARQVAADIDASLTGFFKRGGLTLSTLLLSSGKKAPQSIPASVINFISEASAQYEELSLRLAFWRGALGAFTEAGDAERQYLGRLVLGFFAFHAIGVFGPAAQEQVALARSTVWLVDSSLQIPALAIASPSNSLYRDVFQRLAAARIRLFSSYKLFLETYQHLSFANDIVRRFGADSHVTLAAAIGDPPFWKQNLFLQGYIEWQHAGNTGDWQAYVYQAIGSREPTHDAVEASLKTIGVEVIDFQDWPGFTDSDFALQEEFAERLKTLMRRHRQPDPETEESFERRLEEKIPPEAEAAVIVIRERQGRFGVLSNPAAPSPAWFVSATSAINALEPTSRITWQPDAFLAFVGTLVNTSAPSSDRAFELVLSGLAESGLNPISEAAIEAAFGQVIDEATVDIGDQREALVEVFGSKYSDRPDDVLRRLPPSRRLLASLQMSNEMVARQASALAEAQAKGADAARRARSAEKELESVGRLRRKAASREAVLAKRRRKGGDRKNKGGPKTDSPPPTES